MTDDITELLHDLTCNHLATRRDVSIYSRAADEIRRLQAERDVLAKRLDDADHDHHVESANLIHECGELRRKVADLEQRLVATEAEALSLRIALERFHLHYGDNREKLECWGRKGPGFCVAADALSSTAGSSVLKRLEAGKRLRETIASSENGIMPYQWIGARCPGKDREMIARIEQAIRDFDSIKD